MEQRIQIKPFVHNKAFKYKVLQITDITFHSNMLRETNAFSKKIDESFRKNKPGRFYFKDKDTLIKNLSSDPDFIEYISEQEKNGYKILIEIPEEGVDIKLGKDAQDFINSVQGKRILRRLYKNSVEE